MLTLTPFSPSYTHEDARRGHAHHCIAPRVHLKRSVPEFGTIQSQVITEFRVDFRGRIFMLNTSYSLSHSAHQISVCFATVNRISRGQSTTRPMNIVRRRGAGPTNE